MAVPRNCVMMLIKKRRGSDGGREAGREKLWQSHTAISAPLAATLLITPKALDYQLTWLTAVFVTTPHTFILVVMVVVLKYCNRLLRRCEVGHVSQQAAQLRAATVDTQLESQK